MAIQTLSGVANAVTETTTPLDLVKKSFLKGTAIATSQTLANNFGRDRYLKGLVAESVVMATTGLLRRRGLTGLCNAITQTDCDSIASMPPAPSPTGNLTLNGSSLSGQRLRKGQSLSLKFVLNGRKIAPLSVNFKLFDLSGRLLIDKKERVSPGGLEVESSTLKTTTGNTSEVGYIFIMRSETLFLEEGKEFETRYDFSVGNSRVHHPLESGFLVFTE